jgi:hypothetical protein
MILFQLPAGPQTINLLTPLPAATDPLTLSLDATQNVTVALSSASAWNDNNALTVSGAGSLAVSGGIEGPGDLTVDAGSSLTASHIVQTALVIGGTAGSPATVTIAASDASGNSLTAVATSSAVMPSAGVAPAASNTSSVGGGNVGGGSAKDALTPLFASDLARVSSLPRRPLSDQSRAPRTFLPGARDGIGLAEFPPLSNNSTGGLPSLADARPASGISPNTFAMSDNRNWLDAVFSMDYEVSDSFRQQWVGADLATLADDTSALGLVDNLFDLIGVA